MNENIKRIATESLQKVTQGKQINLNNLEGMIDVYVTEVIKATVLECNTVLRDMARTEESGDVRAKLKVASFDMNEHFGL